MWAVTRQINDYALYIIILLIKQLLPGISWGQNSLQCGQQGSSRPWKYLAAQGRWILAAHNSHVWPWNQIREITEINKNLKMQQGWTSNCRTSPQPLLSKVFTLLLLAGVVVEWIYFSFLLLRVSHLIPNQGSQQVKDRTPSQYPQYSTPKL